MLKQAFDQFDVDGGGTIDCEELYGAFKAMSMKESKKQVKKMLDDVDDDKSGEIDFPEFLEMMTLKMVLFPLFFLIFYSSVWKTKLTTGMHNDCITTIYVDFLIIF